LRIAPVADVPGPIQKNYFFFFAAFFVDFFAAFLVAFFLAAFFAILEITPSVADDGRSRSGCETRGNIVTPSWLGSSSPPSGRPRQVR
jgi:hypothetical protein